MYMMSLPLQRMNREASTIKLVNLRSSRKSRRCWYQAEGPSLAHIAHDEGTYMVREHGMLEAGWLGHEDGL